MAWKHLFAVVIISWTFALGMICRVEPSIGPSNDVVKMVQNRRRSQNPLLEKAVKSGSNPYLLLVRTWFDSLFNQEKIRVAKVEEGLENGGGYSINEDIADIVALHKDSGNPHLLLAFTNDVEENSMKVWKMFLRGAHLKKCHFYLGIAQMAIAPPPPALKRALWGTLFSDQFEQLCQITVLMVISAPKHPGKPSHPP